MERTAINEFRKQKPDVILQMSLSFNQFGFGSLELTFKVDCCDHIEETIKTIAGPHKVDPKPLWSATTKQWKKVGGTCMTPTKSWWMSASTLGTPKATSVNSKRGRSMSSPSAVATLFVMSVGFCFGFGIMLVYSVGKRYVRRKVHCIKNLME